jgi:hypothetical protein
VGAWWTDRATLEQVRTKDPHDAKHPYHVKYQSFTVQHGKVTKAPGPPRVRVQRLDGNGNATAEAGGYATGPDGSHWWPTVIGFSNRGCWRVTETVRGTSISYVAKI